MKTKKLVVFAIAAGVAYYVFTEQQRLSKRNAALPGVAASLGLDFNENKLPPTDLVNTPFPLLSNGTSPVASNAMSGILDGAQITVFDLSYDNPTEAQENKGIEATQRVDQSVARVSAENLSLPAFTLRPLNVVEQSLRQATGKADAQFGDQINDSVRDALSDIAEFSGLKAIEFDSHPGFAEKYLLTANDETAARSVFNPAVLDYLLSLAPAAIEAQGNEFLYYRPSVLSNEDQIHQLMTEVRGLLALWGTG